MDWSSIDSSRKKVSQHDQSVRNVEPNITVIHTEQPIVGPVENEAMGNVLSEVMTVPSTQQQSSQEGTRFIDIMYSRYVQMPTSHGSFSSHETDNVGGSPVRLCVTDIMPQLDGPASVHIKRRPKQEFVRRTATIPRGRCPDESESDSYNNRRSHDE